MAVKADPSYLEAKANIKALNQSVDLQGLLAGRAWIKEKTKEYPYRIIIQLGDGSELSVKSTELETKDNCFFKFELQRRDSKQFIVPINASLSYVMSEIPYRLEKDRDLLIIEGGQVITWQEGSRKDIDLRGEYTPWFPTLPRFDNSKSTSFTHVTISFSSICCGIDRETEQKLLSFIKQEYSQIKFTKINWGEEGEVNYTFSVKSLSLEAREDFVVDVKKIVDQGKFVNLSIGDTVNQE